MKGQVGIIVFKLNNEYFTNLITEVEEILHKMRYSTVVMMTHYDKSYEIECIRNMYNMGVKGIILCSVNSGDVFKNYLDLFNMPIVAVGNNIGAVPYVGIDDYAAMRDMALDVINSGYENLFYFSPALKYDDAYAQHQRFNGFLNAVGDKPYELVTDIDQIKKRYKKGSAIICSTDYYAISVYLKSKGAKIFGFDNLNMLKKYNMNINSVAYSVREMAQNAIDIIMGKKKYGSTVKHYIARNENLTK